MIDDMGIFRTTIAVAPLVAWARKAEFPDVMVDTGSEFSWLPADVLQELGIPAVRSERFESADGRILERPVGFAMLFAAGRSGPSVVVFGEPEDMVLLGAHGLEGLNLRIDLGRKELVPAGPVPAARVALQEVGSV
jgi:predicted aspartyl protease